MSDAFSRSVKSSSIVLPRSVSPCFDGPRHSLASCCIVLSPVSRSAAVSPSRFLERRDRSSSRRAPSLSDSSHMCSAVSVKHRTGRRLFHAVINRPSVTRERTRRVQRCRINVIPYFRSAGARQPRLRRRDGRSRRPEDSIFASFSASSGSRATSTDNRALSSPLRASTSRSTRH